MFAIIVHAEDIEVYGPFATRTEASQYAGIWLREFRIRIVEMKKGGQ
jgi:hypothetical protein